MLLKHPLHKLVAKVVELCAAARGHVEPVGSWGHQVPTMLGTPPICVVRPPVHWTEPGRFLHVPPLAKHHSKEAGRNVGGVGGTPALHGSQSACPQQGTSNIGYLGHALPERGLQLHPGPM